jgi:GNAT superfamily N-acetyltransferase
MFKIRLAVTGEEDKATKIGDKGRSLMQNIGNPQWDTGYPQLERLIEDIELSRLYFAYDDEEPFNIIGMAVFQKEKDTEYEAENFWKLNDDYISIHRLVSLKKGIGKFIISEGMKLAKEEGKLVRIDTHPKNFPMLSLIRSFGFSSCGNFYQAEYIDGVDAIAFEIRP